jgi:hypothetical protein
MDDTNPQHDDGDDRLAGDLLVGAEAIAAYLVYLGVPNPDVYYLKRANVWPIGNTAGDRSKLIASKRRLARHADKIARGFTAA